MKKHPSAAPACLTGFILSLLIALPSAVSAQIAPAGAGAGFSATANGSAATTPVGAPKDAPANPAWYSGGPWDTALFSPDTDAVRKAADANRYPGAKQAVTVFFCDGGVTYRADGSMEYRSVLVYRIENDDGLKNWSDMQLSWSPWHQDQPKFRVRILNPDGKAYWMTDADMLDVSEGSSDGQVYSDQKRKRSPYPNVMVGSLIEEEYLSVSRPYLAQCGMEASWKFSRNVAVGRSRLTLRYPAALPVRYAASQLKADAADKVTRDGETRVTWDLRNIAPDAPREDYVPPENRQYAAVSTSCAAGWSAIASAYGSEIEKLLAANPINLPADLSLPRDDAPAAALAVSRWINARVRYTGLELGENSIIPYPPQAVLSRGYGDCKDKASLMVALLRAAGYKAWISLLRTGPGWDIDPFLYGMTSFNHAIVYVDGKPGFWFDPTVEINIPGTLPYQDEYRFTLIARPDQKELRRTPASAGSENRIEETRTYRLAENGKGSVTEETRYSGAMELFQRNSRLYSDERKSRESLESYFKNYYVSESVPTVGWSDPRDLAKPYCMTVSGDAIGKAQTGYNAAEVTLHLNNLPSFLPDDLLDEKAKPRTQPFRYSVPFAYRLTSVVIPPAGFQARVVPPPIRVEDGDFVFASEWEAQADGSLRGTETFEVKIVEFSPERYEKYRKAVKKALDDNYSLTLTFEHRGEALRDEGRYTEAFEAYRELLDANPDSAIQNLRLSNALQSYMLGQPAIHFARRAAELEPKNDVMWENLANMLMNDGLGRRLNAGWDRDGAIAAWQTAIRLNPANKAHLANLAILYEYDAQGERYHDAAGLARAADSYGGLGDEALTEYSLQFNYWNVLVRLGRLDDANRLIAAIKDDELRNVAKVVTGVLAGNGGSPMKLVDQGLALAKRQAILVTAANTLQDMRRYADAASLLRVAAVANKDSAQLEFRSDLLARTAALDSPGADLTTPVGTIKNLLFDYIRRGQGEADLAFYEKYLSRGARSLIPKIGLKRLNARLSALLGPMVGTGNVALVSDLMLSILVAEPTGDDAQGYRLTCRFPGIADGTVDFFLVREGAEYRVASWERMFSAQSARVIDSLDSGAEATARQWYGWLFAGIEPSTSVRDFSFFAQDDLARSTWAMRLAANAMLVEDERASGQAADAARLWESIADRPAFLKKAAQAKLTTTLAEKFWLALAIDLADASLGARALDQAVAIAHATSPYLGDDDDLRSWYAVLLANAGQGGEAEAFVEKRFAAAKADDAKAFQALLWVYQLTLNFSKLDEVSAKYADRLTTGDLNNLAWADLFREPSGVPSATAVERSRRSVTQSKGTERSSLHTLATVYAATGRFDDAHSVLAKLIEVNPGGAVSTDDWYIIGLIADGYGFHDAAREAWQKVERDADALPQKTDTWVLAQARLR